MDGCVTQGSDIEKYVVEFLLIEFCFSMEYIGENTVGFPLTGKFQEIEI